MGYFTRLAFKDGFSILKAAFSGFMNDMALKYSASLSYYTVFSLAPLLLLVISLAGIFFGGAPLPAIKLKAIILIMTGGNMSRKVKSRQPPVRPAGITSFIRQTLTSPNPSIIIATVSPWNGAVSSRSFAYHDDCRLLSSIRRLGKE